MGIGKGEGEELLKRVTIKSNESTISLCELAGSARGCQSVYCELCSFSVQAECCSARRGERYFKRTTSRLPSLYILDASFSILRKIFRFVVFRGKSAIL